MGSGERSSRLFRELGEAQFIATEQDAGEQTRLRLRPEHRSKEGRLNSHVLEVILHFADPDP